MAKDFYYKNASGIKIIRWNPEDIEITYNDITGDYTYFYTIPAVVRNDIVIGRKDIVEGIPQVFIQAMREQKGVIFSKDNFFHMRRPTLATQDRGWGTPLLLPVLKDTFYLQLMKKAQEASTTRARGSSENSVSTSGVWEQRSVLPTFPYMGRSQLRIQARW